ASRRGPQRRRPPACVGGLLGEREWVSSSVAQRRPSTASSPSGVGEALGVGILAGRGGTMVLLESGALTTLGPPGARTEGTCASSTREALAGAGAGASTTGAGACACTWPATELTQSPQPRWPWLRSDLQSETAVRTAAPQTAGSVLPVTAAPVATTAKAVATKPVIALAPRA